MGIMTFPKPVMMELI